MENKETNSKMKISTLNVNGFRGVVDKSVSYETRVENMKEIKKLVDKNLVNKNDIIVIQELPHKIRQYNKNMWFYDPLFNEFKEMFKGYSVIEPKELIDSFQCTVAICKKDSSWKKHPKNILKFNSIKSYGNKFVELECNDITMLGLHMPDDEEMWKLLIKSLQDLPYTFVIGDFNANVKQGEMQHMPREVRKCGYHNLISYDIVTFYGAQSSIDNIYIKSGLTRDKIAKVENTYMSDHALCSYLLD